MRARWLGLIGLGVATLAIPQAQPGGNAYQGGVSQIIAGTNVTISPSGGTGAVTINSSGGGGGGTVTSASVVSANGFAGTVATATTTPAITLSTTITGLLEANGTAIAAATAGNVYGLWTGTCSSTTYLRGDGACATPSSLPSTTNVINGNGSGGGANSGVTLDYASADSSIYFGVGVGTPTGVTDTVVFGYQAGANLTANVAAPNQSDVLIGYQAGQDLTTARETVAIGYQALATFTGTGAGIEDGIGVAIGSQAGFNVQASGSGSFVCVGQKSCASATVVSASVMVGAHAGNAATSSTSDVVVGVGALNATGAAAVTSLGNVMLGSLIATAGLGTPSGTIEYNVVVGDSAGYSMTGGADYNVFLGYSAGGDCTSCNQNVLIGSLAGATLTTATRNVIVGQQAGQNATGSQSALVGYYAGNSLTTGTMTAMGYGACDNNQTGSGNVCFGHYAGAGVVGADNTEIGDAAGYYSITGAANNTDLGYNAGFARTSGASNTVIGSFVGSTTSTTGSNNILIGTSSSVDTVAAGTSNEINIGGLLFWNNASTAAPAVTGCGTSSIDSHANNRSGTVTAGTGTACTVTFAGSGYGTWNHCRVTPHSVVAGFSYSYTLTVLTINATATSGDVFDYDCDGV